MNGEIEPTEQQADKPVNERAAYLAGLEARAKEVITEISELATTIFRESARTPLVQVTKGSGEPKFWFSSGKMDIEATSLQNVIEIAELEAKLAKLKGVAA